MNRVRRFGDYTDVEPPHAELALALAAEFRRVDDQAVERELQRLSERLAALTPTHGVEALQWVGVLVSRPHRRAAPPAPRRCRFHAHQVSCAVLDNLSCRAAESGDLGRAIRAAELKLELPFDPRTHELASATSVACAPDSTRSARYAYLE